MCCRLDSRELNPQTDISEQKVYQGASRVELLWNARKGSRIGQRVKMSSNVVSSKVSADPRGVPVLGGSSELFGAEVKDSGLYNPVSIIH